MKGKIFSKFMSLIIGCHHYIFKKNTDIADKVKNSQVLVRKLSSLDISPTNSVVIKIDAEGAEIEILNQIYEFT
ncbi:hypothetical protein D6V34_12155, partial [Vibrio cholerae]|nr:hypothetical protein [Vibrio cholerae]